MDNNKHIFIECGYYLSPRKKYDSDIWKDIHKNRLFELLIGKANHQKNKPQRLGSVTVGHGQYLRSYRKLQDDLEYVENRQVKRYSLSKLGRMIKELVDEGRISVTETELGTLFTVCNYQIYQDPNSYVGGNLEHSRDTSGTHPEHIRDNNNNSDKSDNSKNLLLHEEEAIYKNEYFHITAIMLDTWKKSYTYIDKFLPEISRVTDIIREKNQRGEIIQSPMAFLHTHLKNENMKVRTGHPDYPIVKRSCIGAGPASVGAIIESILEETANGR
jgi:hypothetical protein